MKQRDAPTELTAVIDNTDVLSTLWEGNRLIHGEKDQG